MHLVMIIHLVQMHRVKWKEREVRAERSLLGFNLIVRGIIVPLLRSKTAEHHEQNTSTIYTLWNNGSTWMRWFVSVLKYVVCCTCTILLFLVCVCVCVLLFLVVVCCDCSIVLLFVGANEFTIVSYLVCPRCLFSFPFARLACARYTQQRRLLFGLYSPLIHSS